MRDVIRENIFSGVLTALITPFKNGGIDWSSLKRVIKAQLEAGIKGFVINGTTAESPTLSPSERDEIFQFVKKYVRTEVGEKFPLIMGTGSNSTADTVANTQAAQALGADAALVVVPYYNRPPQRGLFQHFQRVAQCSSLPIILYNVPSRTVAKLELQTVIELSRLEGIIGIKEATGDISFAQDLISDCKEDFFVTSGDDATFLELTAAGGCGVISVTSHVLPKQFVSWHALGQDGSPRAIEEFHSVRDLNSFLYCESNPIGVKMALHLMGLIDSPELRLPLVQLSEPLSKELGEKMRAAGIL